MNICVIRVCSGSFSGTEGLPEAASMGPGRRRGPREAESDTLIGCFAAPQEEPGCTRTAELAVWAESFGDCWGTGNLGEWRRVGQASLRRS